MGRKGQGNSKNKQNPSANAAKRNEILNKNNNKVLIGQLVESLLKEVAKCVPPEDPWNIFTKVYGILQEIARLEDKDTSSKKETRSPEAIEKFVQWLKDSGVDCKGVEIQEFPELGLGLRATRDFQGGDLILRVPRRVMVIEERVRMSPLGVLIDKDPILKQMPHVTLALYLLLQKYSPDSFWKPYMDILPTSYTTVLYFKPEDFQYLKGSPVYQPALLLYLAIARQYGYFHKLIHMSPHQASQTLKEHFTFDDYRWAVSTVMTRQNKVPLPVDEDTEQDNGSAICLIPLWDMCNHMHGTITTGFNIDADEAECFALKDFKKAEQIFIFYGDRHNAYFFLYNGFVYEDNQFDSMAISLGISNSDPLCEERRAVLQRVGGAGGLYTIYGAPQCCIAGEFLAVARVLCMKKEQLQKCLDSPTPSDLLKQAPVPGLEDVDLAAYPYINTRCKLLLSQYNKRNTSNDGVPDVSGLAIDDATQKHRAMIDTLKRCEVKILQRAIDLTQKKIEMLSNTTPKEQ